MSDLRVVGNLVYDTSKKLGDGSFGTLVFNGFHRDEVKPVAVKRVQRLSIRTESNILQREVELMQKASDHSNILRYICTEMDMDHLFIAMELCGGTLEDYFNGKYQGPRFQNEKEILRQVTQGLSHLHELKIVHRDIKPTNLLIFVPSKGTETIIKPQMKLADFGISKMLKTDADINFTNTSVTNPSGSIGWMAPEVYESNRFDFKVDVWALGLIFFFTLSDGKHPFGNDPYERTTRIKKKESMLLTEKDLIGNIDVQKAIEVIQSMLVVEPENRPVVKDVLVHSFFTSELRRLAKKLLPHCRFEGRNPRGMDLYQLPLTNKAQSRSSTTDRWVFGSPSSTNTKFKTILLMGATGSGKTTLINAMVNYIFGVEWDDPFRFMLINEEGDSTTPKSLMYSQTSKVTVYELHYQVGLRVPYSLIIVDTPGYGDNKGIERDYEITDSIQQLFKGDKDIQVLDAVGFTVNAALPRLTPTQRYIFDSILAIFGNDVRDNIRFLVTFADGQRPPVLEAIKEASITHQLDAYGQPRHHRFNNSGFFTSNQMDGDANFGSMFWKLGMKNFESFFSGLSSMKTISLTLTKEVLEGRKQINVIIDGLTLKINKQLTIMEKLRETKQIIENDLDQINEDGFQHKLTSERTLRVLESELGQIKCDLKLDINTITACLQRLDQIALRPNVATTMDYIELMIHLEMKEKKAGFQGRIKSLESLLDNAQVVNDIRAGKFTVPEAVEAVAATTDSSG